MFNKILVGVDGSENSTRALQVAADLSHKFDAELIVFHAIPHHYQPPMLPIPPFATLSPVPREPQMDPIQLKDFYADAGKAVLKHAEDYLEGLEYGSDLKVEYQLEMDVSPEEFAANFASENRVDLIVVGCNGHHSRLRRALVGTVATKIANEAPCQVLVVR
jgi:nucleotide-binding universal stress UspA family protein